MPATYKSKEAKQRRKEQDARFEQQKLENAKIVATGICPECGAGLRRKWKDGSFTSTEEEMRCLYEQVPAPRRRTTFIHALRRSCSIIS